MGIRYVTPEWDDYSRREDEQGNVYQSVTYYFHCDSFVPATTIYFHESLPNIGAGFIIVKNGLILDSDLYSRLKTKDVKAVADSFDYRVTLNYDTKPFSEGQKGHTENSQGKPSPSGGDKDVPPDQRPYTISTGDIEVEMPMTRDFRPVSEGGPQDVVNDARQPFDPPVMKKVYYPTITITKTQSVWYLEKKLTYQNTLNANKFTIQGYEFQPRQLLLARYNECGIL